MPKGVCSSRVSRPVNGAMVEVSGKTQHSELTSCTWARGPDVFTFDNWRWATDSESLRRTSEFLDA